MRLHVDIIKKEALSHIIAANKKVDRVSYLLTQELSGLKNTFRNNKEVLAFLNVQVDPIVGNIHKLTGNLHRTSPTILRDPKDVQLKHLLKIAEALESQVSKLRQVISNPMLSNGKGIYFRSITVDFEKNLKVSKALTVKAIGVMQWKMRANTAPKSSE
jgi:hypothetical protein